MDNPKKKQELKVVVEKKKQVIELEVRPGEIPYTVSTPDQLWSAIVDDILIKYGSGIKIEVRRRR